MLGHCNAHSLLVSCYLFFYALMILTTLVFLLILGIIVFVHELGHFLVARKNGVLVEEFGIGIPPRLIGIQKDGDKLRILWGNAKPQNIENTIYSFNWLPIGGFVKLYGDGAGGEGSHIDPKLQNKAFENKGVWARASVMVAGVLMNFIFASAIFYFLLWQNGFVSDRFPLIGHPHIPFGQKVQSVVAIAVTEDSPAKEAGLAREDILLRIKSGDESTSSQDESDWLDINQPSDLVNFITTNGEKPVMLEVKKLSNGQTRNVVVTPRFDPSEKRPLIGVNLASLVQVSYSSMTDRIFAGFLHSYNLTAYNLQLLGVMFFHAIETKQPQLFGEAVSGPVAIGALVGETISRSGDKVFYNLLNLSAIISLSLAFMNILPIPALDGGRIALLIPEMLFRRKIPKPIEKYINYFGFFILIALSFAITIKDIVVKLK
jgi:regulator of sigma E protease